MRASLRLGKNETASLRLNKTPLCFSEIEWVSRAPAKDNLTVLCQIYNKLSVYTDVAPSWEILEGGWQPGIVSSDRTDWLMAFRRVGVNASFLSYHTSCFVSCVSE